MGKAIDISGKKFGMLLALEPTKERISRQIAWLCVCDCGKECLRGSYDLKTGHVKSCGCKVALSASSINYKHGCARDKSPRTSEYLAWRSMMRRCYSEKEFSYPRYGGSGITVCAEWRNDFPAFLRDMGARPRGMTLDRKDCALGYFKDNCRWATDSEQCCNRRKPKNNSTGVKNVSWISSLRKYRVVVRKDRKNFYFGVYDDLDKAAKVAVMAREKIHLGFANHA